MVQRHPWRRRTLVTAATAGVGLIVWLILRPAPVLVEVGTAARGPMRVTVDEDGETRAHDRFIVASPIPGRMLRVGLEEGDAVRPNEIVAMIEPLPLNQQQREEVFGRVAAAEAAKREAAREDFGQSQRDRKRAEQLGQEKVISAQALEQARNAEITSGEELEAAKFNASAASFEVNVARAGLVGIDGGHPGRKVVSLRSPVAGRVLRVIEKSERVVQAGTPVVVLGDAGKLEIVTDVLTTDAAHWVWRRSASTSSPISLIPRTAWPMDTASRPAL